MSAILFGPYEPDQPAHLSKGLQEATNVYPAANGYRPVKTFAATHTALAAACKGAASFTSPQGASTIIAGTATGLYRAYAGGWTELSSGYNIQEGGRWRFAQFGGVAIAANGADTPVKIDLSDYSVEVLGGTPPVMKLLTVVKDFLVGGVIGGDVSKIQWSGINNAEWWTVGQRQSDYQIMPSGGEITGLIGGEFGIVLQRNRITRMDYVGGNVIFTFNEISTNIGCVTVHSVIQSGQIAFWLSDNGFVMWDGASLKPIGNERVDRSFFASYDRGDWPNMSTAVDAKNNLVCWSLGNRLYVYNWVLDRWSVIDQAAEIVFGGVTASISLDELDTLYGSLDAVPVSLDDESLLGGDPAFYLFNASHVMGTFSGTNMGATLTTGDMAGGSREIRARSFRPMSDAVAGMTLTVTQRARLGDAGSTVSASTLTTSGDLPCRASGRNLRLSLVHAAGSSWNYSQGIEPVAVRGARR